MPTENATQLLLQIQAGDDATPEELDDLARALLNELRDLPAVTEAHLMSGPAPLGSKAGEALTIGSLAIAIVPALVPKVLDWIQAWALRSNPRVVKFKGTINGHELQFEGAAEDLSKLLANWPPPATPAA
jgi:hypothetical protein